MNNLIYYPNSALLTQCADVNFDKIDVQQYYDSMIDVMYKNNGIGLAAPLPLGVAMAPPIARADNNSKLNCEHVKIIAHISNIGLRSVL